MNRNVNDQILTNAFMNYAKTIWVYLSDLNAKTLNFDPYRNTGYTTSNQNPLPVKAIIRQIRANSLIMRELGLTVSGAIELIVKEQDIELIRLATKITYNNEKYSIYNDALGGRVQIYEGSFGFFKVVIFHQGKK